MLVFTYFFGFLAEYVIVMFSMFLHESAHIVLFLMNGYKVQYVKILPVGFGMYAGQEPDSVLKKVLFLLAGPFLNLALFMLLYFICQVPGNLQLLSFACHVNKYLFFFSMFPVIPLDGGRIAGLLLSEAVGMIKAYKILNFISLLFTAVLTGIAVLQFFYGMHNFTAGLVAVYILFYQKLNKTEASLMNIRNILSRRSKIREKGIYPLRCIVAIKSMFLSDVLKHLDFDRFHIIYVIDDSYKVCGIFTEQEIINFLVDKKHATFEKLIL